MTAFAAADPQVLHPSVLTPDHHFKNSKAGFKVADCLTPDGYCRICQANTFAGKAPSQTQQGLLASSSGSCTPWLATAISYHLAVAFHLQGWVEYEV